MAYLRFSYSNWYVYESTSAPECTLEVYHVNGFHERIDFDYAKLMFHAGFDQFRQDWLVEYTPNFSDDDLKVLYGAIVEWYLDARGECEKQEDNHD